MTIDLSVNESTKEKQPTAATGALFNFFIFYCEATPEKCGQKEKLYGGNDVEVLSYYL